LFQKYIQNKFLLTALYILVFSFIVSFFWTKNQIKNQFDAVLEINYTTLNTGTMQVYFDDGTGLSEDKSFRKNYVSSERKQNIYFPLKNRNYQQFRIDPIDSGNTEFIIHDIKLIDISQGKVLHDFDKEKFTSNQLIVDKSQDLKLIGKETTDPQIYLNAKNIEVIDNITNLEKIKFFISKFLFLFLFIGLIYCFIELLKQAIEEKNKNLIVFFILFPIIFLLLIIRTPDALISPVLYTEDGTWLGRIYIEGFWNVLINARADYLVIGNILGLYFAKYLSYTFFTYDVSTLPFFISILSYLFFSIIASIPILLLKNHIRLELLIVLSLLIVLLPFGYSTNEIIGRLSNIGYFFFPLSIILLIYRLDVSNEKKKVIIIDALLVFCMLTNPMVVLFIITYFLLRYFFSKSNTFEYKSQLFTFIIASSIFVYILYLKITVGHQATLTTEKFLTENLFEVSISRSVLYPFIFPIYSKLGDIFSFIILLIFLTTFYFVFKTLQYKDKKVFLILSFALVFVSFLTTFTKPGLTHWIKDYSGTFPDRYFSAQNIMSLLVVIFIAEKALIVKNKYFKNISKIFIFALILIYAVSLSNIIEFKNPKLKIMINDTFTEALDKTYKNKEKTEIYQIPIYFDGWKMQLPFKYVINTSLNKENK
jgi:hypothetical protein